MIDTATAALPTSLTNPEISFTFIEIRSIAFSRPVFNSSTINTMKRLITRRQISTADFPRKNAAGSSANSKISSIRNASSDFQAAFKPLIEYFDGFKTRRVIMFFITKCSVISWWPRNVSLYLFYRPGFELQTYQVVNGQPHHGILLYRACS